MASPATISFTAVDTTTRGPVKDEVESPSISSTNALARYEYQAGHANTTEGTKILMVEWEDDDTTRGVRGDWHISWDGSTRVLPANENQIANDVHRMYFLLPPGVAVPTSVSLTLRPQDTSRPAVVWHTNPLPALFPPELGASARAAGKKGVLHTIWAKKRLQVLQKEIDAESRNNIEGIGLQMAVDEKEWIETTFGVNARPAGLSLQLSEPSVAQLKGGPASPRSPGGGRLMEKLAGLKLSTNKEDLTPVGGMSHSNPLSPESSDVAVSSFALFKGANPSALAAKPPQQPQAQAAPPRKIAAAIPPPSIIAQQGSGSGMAGMGSLNALSGPAPVFQSRGPVSNDEDEDEDKDDGLFALPISPRSPEVGKSPFSFGGDDTAKYMKEQVPKSWLASDHVGWWPELETDESGTSDANSVRSFHGSASQSCHHLLRSSSRKHYTLASSIRCCDSNSHICNKMLPLGRGSIAHVQYTGDEAAGEIRKLLDAVIENEDDFEKWEAIVTRASELEGGVHRNSSPSAIELVRNVYDCFLTKFPLFFGYWKKYADLEFAIGGTETAEMVYERGVSCISTSVDLWANYCTFKMDTSHNNDIIRDLFERGAHFVGLDFQSHPFWDKYIEFEERVQEPANATKLYSRVFRLPIYQFARYYEKFSVLLGHRPVEELVDAETLELVQKSIQSENQGQPEKPPLEVERHLRQHIHQFYYDAYSKTQQEVQGRWNFEQEIKRPYFHVTELEDSELDNWRKYLDYEEKQGDFQRTCFLYERCLVACALYDEFWLRYARWMFSQGRDEDTRIIYMRASCIFVSISAPTVRLNWARFEEKLGRTSVARDIYVAILDQAPGHQETLIALANAERRHEGNDAAIRILEDYIGQSDNQIGGILVGEQVRILWQCKGALDEARKVFTDKVRDGKFLDSRDFWVKYLEFEIAQPSTDQEETHKRVKAVHDLLRTKGRFSPSVSKELSQLYMNFLLNRGGKDAAEEYMKLDNEIYGYKRKGQPHSTANKRHRK
ncbi:TPR-like protein [Setomelanomma holmii]|uniref:TPR-like protein n=1 Tax=Setomelanomma holmii TaxID=210430 RepID=A0A9P4LNF4_9PLEO|nr:TPR-like protein [Setomelanomma holmii]